MTKLLTTKNKKIVAAISLALVGWHSLTSSSNAFNFPSLPEMITSPKLGGFSVISIAAIITLITVFMIWTEY